MIDKIGIDIDWHGKRNEKYLQSLRKQMRRFGKITEDYPTKHGHHFRIHLEKPVNFWDSIYLRKFLQDDIKRMFYDIMRYKHGLKIQDVLWQKKTYLRDAVLLKGEK